jgi:hypothetical protein
MKAKRYYVSLDVDNVIKAKDKIKKYGGKLSSLLNYLLGEFIKK